MESPKRHPKAIGFKSSVDFGPIPGAIMPICLNPSVTQKPEELCCGMGCPDEELLDLDTPSCSPVGAERKQDYRIIKDKSGKERYLRTAQGKDIEGGFYESNRPNKIKGITSPHSWTKKTT